MTWNVQNFDITLDNWHKLHSNTANVSSKKILQLLSFRLMLMKMKQTRRPFWRNWNWILLQLKDAKIKELKNVIALPKCSTMKTVIAKKKIVPIWGTKIK